MLGLYGIAGKLSAVVGPPLYGVIVATLLDRIGTGAYQVAILSLLGLMVIGFLIVRGVPEGRDPLAEVPAVEPALVPPGELPA
jgi:MFS-type transporter involved in bile tolerance (Atg22 family)